LPFTACLRIDFIHQSHAFAIEEANWQARNQPLKLTTDNWQLTTDLIYTAWHIM
jgi:hypothetical protein